MTKSERLRTQNGGGQVRDVPAVAEPIPWLYTVPEAAAVLRLSVRTVRRLIAQQQIATIHIGRAVRIHEEALRGLIEGK